MYVKWMHAGCTLGVCGVAVMLTAAPAGATTVKAGQGSAYAARVSISVSGGSHGSGAFGPGDFGTGNIGMGNIGMGNIGMGNFGTGDVGSGDFGSGHLGPGGFGTGNVGVGLPGIDTGRLGASSTLGPTSASVVDTGLQGTVSAKVLTSSSHRDPVSGAVTEKAALAEVTLPVLQSTAGSTKASVISSECRSTGDGITASSNLADVDLGKLGSVSVGTAPNTRFGLPGVVEVIANEQIHNANGSLTVNALDIKLLGGQTESFVRGSMVLASATCGAAAVQSPPVTSPPTMAPTAPATTPPTAPTMVPPSSVPTEAPTATPVPTNSSVVPGPTASSGPGSGNKGGTEVPIVPVGAPETGDGTLAAAVVA